MISDGNLVCLHDIFSVCCLLFELDKLRLMMIPYSYVTFSLFVLCLLSRLNKLSRVLDFFFFNLEGIGRGREMLVIFAFKLIN